MEQWVSACCSCFGCCFRVPKCSTSELAHRLIGIIFVCMRVLACGCCCFEYYYYYFHTCFLFIQVLLLSGALLWLPLLITRTFNAAALRLRFNYTFVSISVCIIYHTTTYTNTYVSTYLHKIVLVRLYEINEKKAKQVAASQKSRNKIQRNNRNKTAVR